MLKKRGLIYGILIILIILIVLNFNNIIFLFGFFTDQVNLILKSEDIGYIIDNNLTDMKIISQLQLVPDIMEFGNNIGFPKTGAYSKYISLDREVFYYSLSASKKDKFEYYLWRWLFIGALPYKGFINKEDAMKEEQWLKDKGYDTYIGESSAMSTLGFLPDPIITTMINKSDTTILINTIFHERTHQLFFKKDYVVFNENSAVLLGSLATLEFVKEKFGEDSEEYDTQLKRINDLLVFSEFINEFYEELNVLYYSSDLTFDEKIIERENIFRKNMERFDVLKWELNISFKSFWDEEINNAYIISFYTYYGNFYLYYRVYEKLDDLKETILFFNDVANSEEEPDDLINDFLKEL